jgi:hypothetical protein
MRNLYLAISCLMLGSATFAQSPTVSDIQQATTRDLSHDSAANGKWHVGGVFGLNINQGGSRNWAAGAENFSLSIGGSVNAFANKNWGKWSWMNTLDMGYAFVNTSSQGVRKTDDKIDLYSKIGYKIAKKWRAAGIVNFRSQFTDGFDYDYLGEGLRRRTSGFFAPAYATVAPGVEYQHDKHFSVFFTPFAMRSVIVTNGPYSYLYQGGVIPGGGQETPLANLYGVDPEKEVDFQLGAFISARYQNELFKNVFYTTRLDLYSNYLRPSVPNSQGVRQAKPQNIDIFWTNTLSLKVNKWLAVTYNFDLIYDDDVRQFGESGKSPATQMRSALSIGVATKF